MEDERNQPLPSPRGFRLKFWKIMTLTFLILVGLSAVSFAGIKTTSTSKFCSSCHEMKPEYYTWKASTHSEVECDSCHIAPGGENLVKEKMGLVEEVYRSITNTYAAPIQMPTKMPNYACESCHNMETRTVSPSGDLIIPHDKHMNKNISCIQCHSSVAHGKVSKRLVTFETDYSRWDETLGHSLMSDSKYTSPTMEECMDCHQARKVSTECKTCHTSTMYPKSHSKAKFSSEKHSQQAKNNISTCNNCHKYMSTEKISGFESSAPSSSYLSGDKSVLEYNLSAKDYSKENTFCRDCHSQKPVTHNSNFFSNHGTEADGNQERCLTCHDYQKTNDLPVTTTTCATCHGSSHGSFNEENHRLRNSSLTGSSITKECYTCHTESTCKQCHKDI